MHVHATSVNLTIPLLHFFQKPVSEIPLHSGWASVGYLFYLLPSPEAVLWEAGCRQCRFCIEVYINSNRLTLSLPLNNHSYLAITELGSPWCPIYMCKFAIVSVITFSQQFILHAVFSRCPMASTRLSCHRSLARPAIASLKHPGRKLLKRGGRLTRRTHSWNVHVATDTELPVLMHTRLEYY